MTRATPSDHSSASSQGQRSHSENTVPPKRPRVKGAPEIRRLGQKVRRLREAAGMSQTDLALQLGMSARSKGYISEIESGVKVPPPERIVLLARHFDVTTDYLMRDDLDEDWVRREADMHRP